MRSERDNTAGRYPNRTKLAETIEVTTKTIQRDIDYMRYQMSVPIEFDYARGGYYFTKPMTELPLFQLTEAELVSIFVAQKALEAYKGTAFEQPLRTAFQKLQAATGSANISVSWEDFDSAISFRQFAAYLPDATIFSELAKAIRNGEAVAFGYKKLAAKTFEKRTVEPWHLACVAGQRICSVTTGAAKPAGSSCSPGCKRFPGPRTSFRTPNPPAPRSTASSGIVFKSGKAKMLN